jgi:hypothetical protein
MDISKREAQEALVWIHENMGLCVIAEMHLTPAFNDLSIELAELTKFTRQGSPTILSKNQLHKYAEERLRLVPLKFLHYLKVESQELSYYSDVHGRLEGIGVNLKTLYLCGLLILEGFKPAFSVLCSTN